jgi:hypothetical protein
MCQAKKSALLSVLFCFSMHHQTMKYACMYGRFFFVYIYSLLHLSFFFFASSEERYDSKEIGMGNIKTIDRIGRGKKRKTTTTNNNHVNNFIFYVLYILILIRLILTCTYYLVTHQTN